MKITFDTEADTYENALATLSAAFGVAAPATDHNEPADVEGSPANGSDDYYTGGWNRKRLKRFASNLSPDAAEAVRYIAAHAPTVSMDETIKHMSEVLGIKDFSGQAMGGRMASVGFSWKAVPGAKAAPLFTDYRYRVYRMDEGIAALLREFMGEPSGQKS